MAGINRISGLASGMDIDQLVKDMMKGQQLRLDTAWQNKQIWQWRQEAYRTVNTSLLTLRNKVFDLKLQGNFQARRAVSSDESLVAAAAGANASVASYQIKVEQLASVATNCSTDKISDGTLKTKDTLWSQRDAFSGDFEWTVDENDRHSFSFEITVDNQVHSIEVDGDTETFDSLLARINRECGVSVFYDAAVDKVSLSTNKTGNRQDGAEIQVSGSFLTDVLNIDASEEQGGADALFEINGLTGLTSHDNTYTVNGVTFNFKGADINKTVAVSVEEDIDQMVDFIKDFVDKYNEIIDGINEKLNEKRYSSYPPLTEEQIRDGGLTDRQIDAWEEKSRSGLLRRDEILSGALSEIRMVMSGIVQGITDEVTVTNGFEQYSGPADRLSMIGITTGSYLERGKLHLDEAKLREALQSNSAAVMNLFTRTRDAEGKEISDPEQKGIAVRLYDSVNKAMSRITSQAGSAGSLYDDSYIGRTVRQIDERMALLEEQYARLEDRYYRQFTAMEQAIAKMNSQSMWLNTQLMSGGQ
jgi:flagellar hook-associated protein 2